MSKPRAREEFADPATRGPVFTVRFMLTLLLVVLGIAWIAYYYLVVRVPPTGAPPTGAGDEPGGPAFMADLGRWNYGIGLGAVMLGLVISAHRSTPLGRGQGVVVGMLGSFLLGLVWIITFYVFSNDLSPIPVMNDLVNWNLGVGVGFMAVGFAFATRWE